MKSKAILIALVSAAFLGGCDDGGTVTSPPAGNGDGGTAGGAGCTQTSLVSEPIDAGQYELINVPFTTGGDGRVDVRVDWSDASFNVGAFVVPDDSCSEEQFASQSCGFLMASGDDKPRQLTGNLPGGSYDLLIQNFGDGSGIGQSLPLMVEVVSSVGPECPPPSSS